MVKAKLRHVAISTEDPAKTAAWYQELFGLAEVGRTHSGGYYLTDGDINFAVLRIRSETDPRQIEKARAPIESAGPRAPWNLVRPSDYPRST